MTGLLTNPPRHTAERFSTGKARPAGCECDFSFTCRVCLERAAERNAAEARVPDGHVDRRRAHLVNLRYRAHFNRQDRS